ncbi:MAG: hypothetical protein PHR98_00760 [Candidatus Shapirobacteria bacterium]|nr:hypothetical protein [Candidatus Shapirobacteria bacterium]
MDKKDLKQIADLMDVKMDTKLAKYNQGIEEKMFQWKSEIVDSVDVLAAEIRDEREFRDISSHQISGNTRRIEKLESKVFGAVQSVV